MLLFISKTWHKLSSKNKKITPHLSYSKKPYLIASILITITLSNLLTIYPNAIIKLIQSTALPLESINHYKKSIYSMKKNDNINTEVNYE